MKKIGFELRILVQYSIHDAPPLSPGAEMVIKPSRGGWVGIMDSSNHNS